MIFSDLDVLMVMIYDLVNFNVRLFKRDIFLKMDNDNNICVYVRENSDFYFVINSYLNLLNLKVNKDGNLKIIQIHFNYEEDNISGYSKYIIRYDNLAFLYVELYPFKCFDLVSQGYGDDYLLWGCLFNVFFNNL